jgi:hypothetical protein
MPEMMVEVKKTARRPHFLVDRRSLGDGFLTSLLAAARAIHELAAPPVADVVTGQAAGLGAQRRHDQHHGDVELSLTGQHSGPAHDGRPEGRYPGERQRHQREDGQIGPPAELRLRRGRCDYVHMGAPILLAVGRPRDLNDHLRSGCRASVRRCGPRRG